MIDRGLTADVAVEAGVVKACCVVARVAAAAEVDEVKACVVAAASASTGGKPAVVPALSSEQRYL